MAEFDLTTRMGQYLDRHLVFPLLEFLSVRQVMRSQHIRLSEVLILLKHYPNYP